MAWTKVVIEPISSRTYCWLTFENGIERLFDQVVAKDTTVVTETSSSIGGTFNVGFNPLKESVNPLNSFRS